MFLKNVIATILAGLIILNSSQYAKVKNYEVTNTIECIHFEKEEFIKAKKESEAYEVNNQIYGAIIPHHLLASDMIADMMKTLENRDIKKILLIAPNHKGIGGKQAILTTSKNWETPFGILKSNKELTEKLKEIDGVWENEKVLKEDHSASALIPFIKYYLKDVEVSVLLLNGNYGYQSSRSLAKKIFEIVSSEDVFVLASIDFSHYLSKEEAYKRDEITKKLMYDRSLMEISALNNDYMDSPSTMITTLELMDMFKANKLKILEHKNSLDIIPVESDSTTSYFSIVFTN